MSIDYRKILNEALLQFIKKVILQIQQDESSDDQLCYITFLTSHPKVILSDKVKAKYPNEITIILQYEYEDLQVFEDRFSVKLSFNDVEEIVVIPYNSIISFSDPEEDFYLKFDPIIQEEIINNDKDIYSKISKEGLEMAEDSGEETKVISLDQFRNKNKTN